MGAKLISLEEHNKTITASVHDPFLNESRPNGIACCKCGKELKDTNPAMLLSSLPPKKAVHCSSCGWAGSRLV